MILNIVKYGDRILTTPASEVTEFDGQLRKLIDDMFETMYSASGLGLAAPQVGIPFRVFVMDCNQPERTRLKLALINPVIELEEGEQTASEGCLSVPGFSFEIVRPQRIVVRGQDTDGSTVTLDVTDLAARCVAHESDHLNGKLVLNHLSALKRDLVERKIKKQIKRRSP
jgi:peptide deformylase